MIKEFSGEYDFLSNFYPCKIEYNGLIFSSVESAYQAQKVLNISVRELFCSLSAKDSKKFSRKLNLRSDWEIIKPEIMYDLVFYKFNCNEELKEKLLNTGDMEIVECNYWNDTYWGVCNGVGKNVLGKILMNVRDELKGEDFDELFDADPDCKHEIVEKMSGVKCSKCGGWFCY